MQPGQAAQQGANVGRLVPVAATDVEADTHERVFFGDVVDQGNRGALLRLIRTMD